MNVVSNPHAFTTPERLRALRLEAAMGCKARQVNLGLLLRQHEKTLSEAARRCDRSARAALGRLMATVADDDRWTPTTTRDLKAAVRGLSTAAARLSAAPDAADTLAWLRDRLAEIAAQDARVRALEKVLADCWPEATRHLASQPAKPRRRVRR